MKSSIKKLKNCKRILEVKLPAEKVRSELENVYENIKKVANIPGYRIGKAPRDLLELHYGKTAKEQVIKRLIPDTYKKVLEEHKLDPIGYPDITDVKFDLKEGFHYKASIETRPEFSLKRYKGLKLKKKKVEVKEEDVLKELESLREANAQKVPKKDGEKKEEVRPKLDDEFAKDLGLETLERLKDAIRGALGRRLEEDAHVDLEVQLINQLVQVVNFEVPESLVNTEKERLIKNTNSRIAYIEAVQKKQDPNKKFEMGDKDKKELEENAARQALRQVKAFFILDKIAESEKIYLKQEELDSYIEETAGHYKKTKEEMRRYLEKNHMLDEIAVNMRNKKVMGFLIKAASIA